MNNRVKQKIAFFDSLTPFRVNLAIAVLAVMICYYAAVDTKEIIKGRWRPEDHIVLIYKYSVINNLDYRLVLAVVEAESGGNPKAVSRAGALGLMQVMPAAQQDVCQRMKYLPGDLLDPEHNIQIATAYLNILTKRFKGDRWLILAGYNMGPTRVARLARQYPKLSSRELVERHAYKETQAYCRKIFNSKYLRIKYESFASGL